MAKQSDPAPSDPAPAEAAAPFVPAVLANVPKVYAAITGVIDDLSRVGISKDRKNKEQGYNFRGIDDVYNVLSGFLAHRQLMILPRVISKEMIERVSSKGNALFYTTVKVEYDLVCSIDGSKHTASYYGEAMDSGDKGMNKAQTAAFKYLCFQMFCIPLEGDAAGRDADATSHEVRAQPVHKEPDLSPQEFVDLLEVAPSLDKLKATFADAWKGYPDNDFRKKFQAAYDKRKGELA